MSSGRGRRSTRSTASNTLEESKTNTAEEEPVPSSISARNLRRASHAHPNLPQTQTQPQSLIDHPTKNKEKEKDKSDESDLTTILRSYFDPIYDLKDEK